MEDLARVLAVLGLVGANAFFVIGEYAVVTARRGRLADAAEAGSAGARTALRLMDDPVRVISTVQVGITAIGILTGAVGEPLVNDLLGDGLPAWAGFVIAFGVVTYLSVVLGELVPKALTLQRAERLAMLIAPAIAAVSVALRPAAFVLQRSAELLLRPFGIREVISGDRVSSIAELRALVDEAEGTGVIPQAQEELLHRVFDFPDREARDVMRPALEVDWLEASLTPDAALDAALAAPHERYPVGDGRLDELVGVVHIHDLLAAARRGTAETVAALARPGYVVPETKDVGPLLREMREESEQLAIVLDEYGNVSGIISIEDLVEELVGEIQDEFDLPDARVTRLSEHTVRIAGSMTIDDFNEEVGAALPQRGPRTLAGLLQDELGRQPRAGEAAVIDGVTLRAVRLDGLRIAELEVRLPEG